MLGGELGLVLGVEREGEDVPCVERLVVGGGDVEGGDLVFLVREFELRYSISFHGRLTDWQTPTVPAR